jgi:hypothetical protein
MHKERTKRKEGEGDGEEDEKGVQMKRLSSLQDSSDAAGSGVDAKQRNSTNTSGGINRSGGIYGLSSSNLPFSVNKSRVLQRHRSRNRMNFNPNVSHTVSSSIHGANDRIGSNPFISEEMPSVLLSVFQNNNIDYQNDFYWLERFRREKLLNSDKLEESLRLSSILGPGQQADYLPSTNSAGQPGLFSPNSSMANRSIILNSMKSPKMISRKNFSRSNLAGHPNNPSPLPMPSLGSRGSSGSGSMSNQQLSSLNGASGANGNSPPRHPSFGNVPSISNAVRPIQQMKQPALAPHPSQVNSRPKESGGAGSQPSSHPDLAGTNKTATSAVADSGTSEEGGQLVRRMERVNSASNNNIYGQFQAFSISGSIDETEQAQEFSPIQEESSDNEKSLLMTSFQTNDKA